jgi:hypothetical protein
MSAHLEAAYLKALRWLVMSVFILLGIYNFWRKLSELIEKRRETIVAKRQKVLSTS